MKTDFKSVDEYIQTFPIPIQPLLEKVRTTIIEKAPEAVESIAYGMPAYKTNLKRVKKKEAILFFMKTASEQVTSGPEMFLYLRSPSGFIR